MLILTGKSTTGKDSISDELIKLGYKRLITYSTRDKRENEIDGITYNFISISDFLEKLSKDFFLEFRYYNTENGISFYGSSKESYKKADDNTFCILTPSGLRKLKENNIPYTAFLIDISDEEILRRQILRHDEPTEAERRFKADKIDFEHCEELIDYTINNENRNVSDVAREIDRMYKQSVKESENYKQ